MTKLRDFWRWSERVQDRFGVRVVLAVLSLVVIGGSLGQIALRASSINRDRNAILEALTTTSLMAGDDVARSLKEKGTFEAGGREWAMSLCATRRARFSAPMVESPFLLRSLNTVFATKRLRGLRRGWSPSLKPHGSEP